MVDLIPYLTKIFGEGNAPDSAVSNANQPNDIAGNPISDKAVLPGKTPPISPGLQNAWYTFLMQNVGMPSPAYPGEINADPSKTLLPRVQDAWQPMDAGTMSLAKMISGGLSMGPAGDTLAQAQKWGGTGGIGNQYMNLMAQFGTPSEAGRGVANLSQYGVSSKESGQPLIDLAYGSPTGPAAFLAPFLMHGAQPSAYQAPNIPQWPATIAR